MAQNPQATLAALQLFQQGQRHLEAGRHAEAAAAFQRAHTMLPDHPGILEALGALAERTGDWAAAEKIWRRYGALRPAADISGRLANALVNKGDAVEAIPFLRAHLERHPDDHEAEIALGLSLCRQKDWPAALACGERALARRADDRAMDIVLNCLFNLGRRAELDGLVEQALVQYRGSPRVESLCGAHLLKRGDYARGFGFQPAIRWRYEHQRVDPARPPADAWDGKAFDGLLLVSGEQGLGEEILASSMFADLVRMKQRTLVDCDPRLLPLFRRSFPEIDFVSRHERELDRVAASGTPYRRLQAMDLAMFLRRDPVPKPQSPWLRPDGIRVAALRERNRREHAGCRVAGISWKSNREFTGVRGKSVMLTDLAALLRLPGLAWLSVQYGNVAADLAAVEKDGMNAPRIDPEIDATNDIDGLAAQLAALDFVVSTSNTTAHIAGAVGVPCHLLLARINPVYWYWGYEGPRTPWYSSISIHRNARDDDWTELAARVAKVLATGHDTAGTGATR